MRDFLFIMSSAINTKHGVYHRATRLRQTKETIDSIIERCKNSDIIVIDGGEKTPYPFEIDKFLTPIKKFISFADDNIVKTIQTNKVQDIVKNMIEMYMMSHILRSTDINWSDYKRVAKISGRYTLNDNFNPDVHLSSKDKLVISKSRESQFSPEVTGNITRQYMSRLFTFDTSLMNQMVDTYDKMLKDMQFRLSEKGYIDIEHLLYKHLNSDIVSNVEPLGIQGNIAPNGGLVSE